MTIEIPVSGKTGPKQVMVIDNDMDMVNLLNTILGKEGYDIIIAVDEKEAIGLMDKITPELIIMDAYQAGDVDLRIITSLRGKSDVPIVVLSTDTESETLKKALEYGADDYVVKPFAARVLSARINAKVRRWRKFHQDILLGNR